MSLRLELTDTEKRWNSYRGENGLPPVRTRRYPYQVQINAANQSATVPHFASRRSRVFRITWTGDVSGVKVNIATSTGDKFTIGPTHVPLLSGHSPYTTYSRSPLILNYPSPLLFPGPPVLTGTLYAQPAWELDINPNIVLPGNVTLQFDYSLEDVSPTGDLLLNAGGAYTVNWVVHQWEFPGFEGGAS